jgi:NADPH-dependent 2,4-dienoyl-CoA reductase/sulfur reductase-like enzyme
MEEKGIKLALGELVQKFEGENGKVKKVLTTKGEHEADLVIMCIGFRPNTDLLKGQIDMLDSGAILVDDYMRTSNQDVFAAGDSCAIRYNPTGKSGYIPLATNAVRMGTLVARNLKTPTVKYMGTQGTSGIKIFEHNIASTGLTEQRAKDEGIEVKTVTVEENNRPEFMPTYEKVTLKIVYDAKSRRVLGGQIHSLVDMTQTVNTLSVVIQNEMTVEELAFVDFFFQPHYNKPWNILNMAGLNA